MTQSAPAPSHGNLKMQIYTTTHKNKPVPNLGYTEKKRIQHYRFSPKTTLN